MKKVFYHARSFKKLIEVLARLKTLWDHRLGLEFLLLVPTSPREHYRWDEHD